MKSTLPNKGSAVLVFTHLAEVEARTKRLLPQGNSEANRLALRAMLSHTLKVVAASGLPSVVVDSPQQVGRSFGERLYAAVDSVFRQGYQSVIVVGNDCPDLDPATLLRAADQLQSKQGVLGPDRRGGAFLIGMDKSIFSRSLFERVAWQTESTFQDLARGMRGQLEILPAKADLNQVSDLEEWLEATSRKDALVATLRILLDQSKATPESPFLLPSSNPLPHSHRLRAPPSPSAA